MVETKETETVSDKAHYVARVPTDSIEIDATSVKTLGVSFEVDGKEYDGYTAGWFASSQLLKLLDRHVTKTDLRDMDNVSARNSVIENNLPAGNLVFKYDNTGKVWGIVSEKFASVGSERLAEILADSLQDIGVKMQEVTSWYKGVVTYAQFDLVPNGQEDMDIRAGIAFRNSVFGGSATRMSSYVRFEDGTYVVLPNARKFRKIHAGEQEGFVKDFRQEARKRAWDAGDVLARFTVLRDNTVNVDEHLEQAVIDERMTEKAANNVRVVHEDNGYPATEAGLVHALSARAQGNEGSKKEARELRAESARILEEVF